MITKIMQFNIVGILKGTCAFIKWIKAREQSSNV